MKLPPVVVLAFLLLTTSPVLAVPVTFSFTAESAVFDPATGNVQFRIVFNQAPDFSTVDSVGRQADTFQYFISGDPQLPYPANFDSIIRGAEVRSPADPLPIRNSLPPSDDPATGGWGPIRGSVPFSLDGNILTFATPLTLISNHSVDGNFAYRLDTYGFGITTRSIENESSVVPEPATLLLFGSTLAGVGMLRKLHRKRERSNARPRSRRLVG
jgi:PEP-CTERM motif-containing protein